MKKTEAEISLEAAQAVLEEASKRKQERYLKAYEALCKEHGFEIKAAPPQLVLVPVKGK